MKKSFLAIFSMIMCLTMSAQYEKAPAFPGAEGFGRFVTGGRGGEVYHVTKLTDDGSAGTFRWACNKSGKRTIVFDVSGTIYLQSALPLKNGNVSILGQTAPGQGICIADYPFTISASNVIIRYMRFRLGNRNVASHEGDGLGGMDQANIMVDHCSVSWSIDECLSVYGSKNISVQWCMVDQSLVNSGHSKGAHGYGGNWGGSGASYHHNLLAHHTSRVPRLGPRPGTQTDERMDLRNCVMYNWGGNGCYGGEGMNVNIVNNYYKPGPATGTSVGHRIASPGCRTTEYCNRVVNADGTVTGNVWLPMWHVWGKYYVTGNVNNKYSEVTKDNWTYGIYNQITEGSYDGTYNQATRDTMRINQPIPYGWITTHKAETAYDKVTKYAGASLRRDSHDEYIVNDVTTGTARYTGTGLSAGFINNQDEAGGWPDLKSAAMSADTDQDGMPDEWETAHGLNTADAADRNFYNLDSHRYYTNLEVYCNSLVEEQVRNENADADTTTEGYFEEYYPDYKNGENVTPSDPSTGDTGTLTWPMNDFGNFKTATVSSNIARYITSTDATVGSNLTAASNATVNGIVYTRFSCTEEAKTCDGVEAGNSVNFLFTVADGYTFQPTKMTFNACRFGTDGGSITARYSTPTATYSVMESPVNPNRNNNTETTTIEESLTSIVPTGGQHAFSPILYNFSTSKQLGLANIVITGYIPELQSGIIEVGSEESGLRSPKAYNILGQRVSHNTRGLILSNGRKYVK